MAEAGEAPLEEEQGRRQAEIYSYDMKDDVFAMNWSSRKDKKFRLAVGCECALAASGCDRCPVSRASATAARMSPTWARSLAQSFTFILCSVFGAVRQPGRDHSV